MDGLLGFDFSSAHYPEVAAAILLKMIFRVFSFSCFQVNPLHCSLLRMRDKAMSARVAIKRSSYYRNEWQITKASFFRITTAKFFT